MNIRGIYHMLVAGEEVHNKANELSRAQQRQFGERYAAPRDDYDRSFIKYMCRRFMDFDNGNKKWYMLNTIGAIAFLPLWIVYTLRGSRVKKQGQLQGSIVLQNPSFSRIDDILPEKKLELYGDYQTVKACSIFRGHLGKEGQGILWQNILKHPLCFYLNLLLLINLGKYEELIHRYHPKAIFSYADERTPVNPLLTLLCEKKGIDHVGFMHGEVYYQLDKGFFRYTDYLVWDEFYEQLFRSMKCDGAIHCYRPKKLQLEQIPVNDDAPIYITYYDAENSVESLRQIAEIFLLLKQQGKKCLFRPHPRFSNIEVIQQLFDADMIQNGREVSIPQSFLQTRYAAAICSTVLMEAYYAGVPVLIDDVTDTRRLAMIADKDYMMLAKEHALLSSVVQMMKGD